MSLQRHWDDLHAGERARHEMCPDASDGIPTQLFLPLDDPENARVEWGEHTSEMDITRRMRR